MSKKLILKITVYNATDLVPNQYGKKKKSKHLHPHVFVCIQDPSGKSLGKHCEFKTKEVPNSTLVATWDQSALIAAQTGLTGHKLVFQVKDEEDLLGQVLIPMEQVKNIDDVGVETLSLFPDGKLTVSAGFQSVDGRLRGNSRALIHGKNNTPPVQILGKVQVTTSSPTSSTSSTSSTSPSTSQPKAGDWSKRKPAVIGGRRTGGASEESQPEQSTSPPKTTSITTSSNSSSKTSSQSPSTTTTATTTTQASSNEEIERLTEEFEAKKKEFEKRREELERQKSDHEKRSVEATAKLRLKNDEVEKLKKQVEELKELAEITTEKAKIRDLQRQLDETNQALVQKVQKCEHLEKLISSLSEKTDLLDAETKKLLLQDDEEDDEEEQQVKSKKPAFGLRSAQQRNQNDIADTPAAYANFFAVSEDLELLSKVKSKLSSVDSVWLSKFIESDGLENIYQLLFKIENVASPDFPLMMKESQVFNCIRIIFNTQTILEVCLKFKREIITNTVKLALLSRNALLKSQVCLFLAGLCLYGKLGYKFVQSCVKFIAKSPRPYFGLIRMFREEREKGMMTACMSLINSLLAGEGELGARMRVRAIFLNSGIPDYITRFRKMFKTERPLLLQFDVFDKMQKKDQELLWELRFVGNMDLFSARTVFDRVLMATEAMGLDSTLLSILHHILLIPEVADNPRNSLYFVERAARRVTFQDDARALGSMSYEELNSEVFKMLQRHKKDPSLLDDGDARDVRGEVGDGVDQQNEATTVEKSSTSTTAPPPPPPAPVDVSASKPPPPPAPMIPAPPAVKKNEMVVDLSVQEDKKKSNEDELPDETVPEPRKEMRKLFWKKQPDNQGEVFWDKAKQPLEKLEGLFPQLESKFYATKGILSKKKKEDKKIQILTVQFANNINILRSQFRSMEDLEIMDAILDIKNRKFTTSQLEALLKCIPPQNYIDMLMNYDGDMENLRDAERFVLALLTIKDVAHILKTLIFIDEYASRLSNIENQIIVMKAACEEVLTSEKLRGILGLILSVGNFLNYGTKDGKAKGINANSLTKIVQLRSSKNPKYNLLDFLTEFVEEKFEELLDFNEQLVHIEEAMRYQPRYLQNEIVDIRDRVTQIADNFESTPEEEKSGIYAEYFEFIEQFLQETLPQLQQISEEFDKFIQFANMVLEAFGHPTASSLEDLLGSIWKFAKKFRETVEQRKNEKEEMTKFEKLGWFEQQEEEESQTESGKDNEKKKKRKKLGILDKLIAGIVKGDYGLDEDEEEDDNEDDDDDSAPSEQQRYLSELEKKDKEQEKPPEWQKQADNWALLDKKEALKKLEEREKVEQERKNKERETKDAERRAEIDAEHQRRQLEKTKKEIELKELERANEEAARQRELDAIRSASKPAQYGASTEPTGGPTKWTKRRKISIYQQKLFDDDDDVGADAAANYTNVGANQDEIDTLLGGDTEEDY
eukprot:TRINITY_DN633_c0_g3_i1.p1 TRINITY_DN633_c0_g3~~TRINITY_DN633_c0_g3_i1.p1  ORF type:complete len:1460 (+),score=470.14 TRINITY_DN633_c0_g3_i1:36-4382(+)